MGNKVTDKVQGFFWHKTCIYGMPGDIRDDDGGEPERGDFIDRAITMGHARLLDNSDPSLPACHPCMKGDYEVGLDPQEAFVVLSYELTADMCNCRQDKHNRPKLLANDIWKNAPAKEGANVRVGDKLICGDCWYKESNMPPDERKTMPDPINCTICGDPVIEVVVVKGKSKPNNVVDTDELDDAGDDPDMYKIRVTWTRLEEVRTKYEYFINKPDREDLEAIRDGEFGDIAWDVASENSDSENETSDEYMGFIDEGPEDIYWEVLAK